MKTYDEIEKMILEHLDDLNHKIRFASRDEIKDLYEVKSLTLRALVELKVGKDG